MKHFQIEAKLMLLVPIILVAIGVAGAMLIPWLWN